jgi:phosphatidylethanolamine-binding protein (PEBP) family uncharacterized protein
MERPTSAERRPSAWTSAPGAKHAFALLTLLVAVALCGCSTDTATTNGLAATAPVPVKLQSSAIHGTTIPALYTCDGRNISPPLSWGAVPSSVEELALFLVATGLTKGGQATLSIEWAMAGIKPTSHGLRAGEVPHGAFLLPTSSGRRRYSICPSRGSQRYSFALLALPPGARAQPGLTANVLFRNLNSSTREDAAAAIGTLSATYTRR